MTTIQQMPQGEAELRTLVAFSAARSFSVNTNNPIELILPLFEPIAAANHGKLFVATECAAEIASRYDLIVSAELCTHWSGQLLKLGLLVPASSDAVGAAVWNQRTVTNLSDGDFAKDLLNILTELRKFLAASKDFLLQSYTDAELVALLKQGAISSMFPRLYETGGALKSEEEYIYSRFLQHAAKINRTIVESLATLRRAAIICDLILHSREPHHPPKNPQQVGLYFDSPLVMDLVGLCGKVRREHARRLLTGFQQLGFVPLISPEMVFEIHNNINGLLNKSARDRYGPTAEALRKGDFKLDFVEAIRDRLEVEIKKAGIQIDTSFDTYVTKSKLTDALAQSLLALTQSHYAHIEAAERDVRAVRGVYGRRGDPPPRDLYTSKYIFLTSNELLANLSGRFAREHLEYRRENFPIVLARPIAAALADSILGIATTGNMSLTDMLVSAADATQYNVEVFHKIESHLNSIAPDEAADLLQVLDRPDISQLAMDLVRGNPKNVTIESVTQLTKVIKSRLEDEARSRVADERADERRKATSLVEGQEKVIADQKTRINAAVEKLRARHKQDSVDILQHHARATKAMSLAGYISTGVAIVTSIVVGAAVYSATYYADYLSGKPIYRLVIAILCAAAAGFPLLGLPATGEYFRNIIAKAQNERLTKLADKYGYEIVAPMNLTEAELHNLLDGQFDEKVDMISTPLESMATRESLFD